MIHEVDEALRRLVRDEALRGSTVEIALEAPTKEWSARRNAPTVNLYLYDIREDVRRRQRGEVDERDDRGVVLARRPMPRFVKLSYLVTAWTQRPEDEHRLLSLLLAGLLCHEAVPARLFNGSIGALGIPVPMTVALPPPEDRSFADVWTALGGELKPSVDLVVSAPIELVSDVEVGPPVTVGLQMDLAAVAGSAAEVREEREVGMARRPGGPDDGRVGHQPVAGAAPPRVAMRRVRS